MNDSEYTTCPYCGDAMPPRRRKHCGQLACKRAFNRERAIRFTAAHPGYYAKYDTANCHEHVCPWCGKTFKNHKDKPGHCSVECWRLACAEATRSRLLPILHPNPAPCSVLPASHPARQSTPRPRRFVDCHCLICGLHFVAIGVRHATCSDDCAAEHSRAYRHMRQAIERAFTRGAQPGVFTVNEWGRRLIEYGHRCAYCGDQCDMQIEHVFPLGRGGSSLIANIVPACRDCNQDKGIMTPEEWAVSGSARVATLDPSTWPSGKWDKRLALPLSQVVLKMHAGERLLPV